MLQSYPGMNTNTKTIRVSIKKGLFYQVTETKTALRV